jgi:hypothetical protein
MCTARAYTLSLITTTQVSSPISLCPVFVPAANFVQRAACSTYGGQQNCQNSIFSIEGQSSVTVYNLNVLGSQSLVDKDGHSLASYSDNIGVFTNNIAYFST